MAVSTSCLPTAGKDARAMHLICQNGPGHPCAFARDWPSELREQPSFRCHAGPVRRGRTARCDTLGHIWHHCANYIKKNKISEAHIFCVVCIVYILHGRVLLHMHTVIVYLTEENRWGLAGWPGPHREGRPPACDTSRQPHVPLDRSVNDRSDDLFKHAIQHRELQRHALMRLGSALPWFLHSSWGHRVLGP